jgi:hypothetical protein
MKKENFHETIITERMVTHIFLSTPCHEKRCVSQNNNSPNYLYQPRKAWENVVLPSWTIDGQKILILQGTGAIFAPTIVYKQYDMETKKIKSLGEELEDKQDRLTRIFTFPHGTTVTTYDPRMASSPFAAGLSSLTNNQGVTVYTGYSDASKYTINLKTDTISTILTKGYGSFSTWDLNGRKLVVIAMTGDSDQIRTMLAYSVDHVTATPLTALNAHITDASQACWSYDSTRLAALFAKKIAIFNTVGEKIWNIPCSSATRALTWSPCADILLTGEYRTSKDVSILPAIVRAWHLTSPTQKAAELSDEEDWVYDPEIRSVEEEEMEGEKKSS